MKDIENATSFFCSSYIGFTLFASRVLFAYKYVLFDTVSIILRGFVRIITHFNTGCKLHAPSAQSIILVYKMF